MQKRDVINNYNREGGDYDNIRYGRTQGGRFFSEVELGNTLRLIKDGRVLHIGTATGRVSVHLTSKGLDYVGLEISDVMAKITKETLNGFGTIIRGDAEHLPFKAGVFDNVVCVRSFHFLPHPETFLSEAHSVLKEGGHAIVSFEKKVPARHLMEKFRIVPTPLLKRNYYLNSQVAQMVENAGFSAVFVGNVTKLPLLVYWRMKRDVILRRLHDKIPRWLGTVGVVVGRKLEPNFARLSLELSILQPSSGGVS